MKWLVTTKTNIDLDKLNLKLSSLGCEQKDNQTPIPLDNDEQVITVEGPSDLPDRAKDEAGILKINPSSEMELY
jgi:hypothetical protein